MKRTLLAAVLAAVMIVPAHARHYRHVSYARADAGEVVAHPAGCPWRLFCGCGVSVYVFGKAVVRGGLALASEWGRRFMPAAPAGGNVAWRPGHVFAIKAVNGDGTVVAYDPNSGGHLTRVHTVSLRGYHVVDPRQVRVAAR